MNDSLSLRYYPDGVLRQQCKEVLPEQVDHILSQFIPEMTTVMHRYNGVGLAAPQVGLAERFFIVFDQDNKKIIVLINPEITTKSGKATSDEGCLSVPGIYGKVTRAAKITVQFIGSSGKTEVITAEGSLSYIIQHELDHLNGMLLIDRFSTAKKLSLRRKLQGFKGNKSKP